MVQRKMLIIVVILFKQNEKNPIFSSLFYPLFFRPLMFLNNDFLLVSKRSHLKNTNIYFQLRNYIYVCKFILCNFKEKSIFFVFFN